MGTKLTNEENVIKLNSLLIAIIISANIIAIALNMLVGLNNSIVLPFILCSFISLLVNRRSNLIVVFALSFFFLLFFLISYIQLGASTHLKDYLLSFFTFGITSFIVASQPFDAQKVMRYIPLIYLVTSWIFLFLDIDHMLPGNKMGLGYLTLPVILIGIYQITTQNLKVQKKLFYFVLILWFGYFMIKVGTRGTFLSIGIYIFLLILNTRFSYKKLFLSLVMFISSILIYLNFLPLLLSAQSFLMGLNIKSNFIEKTILAINEDNLSNGRSGLYDLAFNGFKENWLYGKGIGNFHDTYLIYVHDIFLQILNESGILLAIPVFSIILYGLFLMFFSKKIDKQLKLFICFIFSISIPRLVFSSIFWKEQSFWIFMILIISFYCFKRYSFEKK